MWFITNWKLLAGAIPAFVLAYFLHSLDVDRINNRAREQLINQVKFDNAQCEKDKQITKETADDLQQKNATLQHDLVAAKLRRPAHCVVPSTNSTGGINGSGGAANAATYGLSSEWLLDFAAEGNGYQNQVTAWQEFWAKIQKANIQ